MSDVPQYITDGLSPITPDPCGEAGTRDNWANTWNNFKKLNAGNQIFDQFGNPIFKKKVKKLYVTNLQADNFTTQNITYGGLARMIWFDITAITDAAHIVVDVAFWMGGGNPGNSLTVYVPNGMFPNKAVGDKGNAIFLQQPGDLTVSASYAAVYIAEGRTVTVSGFGTATGTSATALTISGFTYANGAAGAIGVVVNPRNHVWRVGDNLWLAQNGNGDWEVVDVTLHTNTYQVQSAIDTANKKLQYVTKPYNAESLGTESSTTTDYHTGTACP